MLQLNIEGKVFPEISRDFKPYIDYIALYFKIINDHYLLSISDGR